MKNNSLVSQQSLLSNRAPSVDSSTGLVDAFSTQFAKRVEAHIVSQTPKKSLATTTDVVELYNDSIEFLQRMNSEAGEFLERVPASYVHVQGGGSGYLERARIRVTTANIQLPDIQLSPALRSELFALPMAESKQILRHELAVGVREFSRNFACELERLAIEQIVGLIEFTAANGARFFYYEKHITEGSQWTEDSRGVYRSGTVTTESTSNLHHLTEVRRFRLNNYTELMPSRIQDLLDQAPLWLRPEIEIVEGTLFRHDQFTRVKTESWEKWTKVRPEPGVTLDPAAVIGPFVLGGWLLDETGEAEHEAQCRHIARQQTVMKRKSEAKRNTWLWAVGIGVLQVLVLLIHLVGFSWGAWLQLLGLLSVVPSMIASNEALQWWCLSLGKPPSIKKKANGIVAFGQICLSWQLFFVGIGHRSASTLLVSGLFAAGGVYLGHKFLKHIGKN